MAPLLALLAGVVAGLAVIGVLTTVSGVMAHPFNKDNVLTASA